MASPTRQRLIDSAFELFYHNGFHAIGLDRVLGDAGVSKQTFYNHFESKDELILAVLEKRAEWEHRTFLELLVKLAGTDPRDQLVGLFDVLDAWFNSPWFEGCIFLTAAAEFPSHHDPAHQVAAEYGRTLLRGIQSIAEKAEARDPKSLAEKLHMLMDGALVVRHMMNNTRAAAIAREAAELLIAEYLPAERRSVVLRQAIEIGTNALPEQRVAAH